MTKKDFERPHALTEREATIAEIIKEARQPTLVGPLNVMVNSDYIANRFCEFLATTNSRFDSDRFLRACGIEGY